MSLKKENLYHPFTTGEFAFFTHDTFSEQNYTTPNLLQNIDLYYQPVEEPTIGILFIVLGLFRHWTVSN